MFQSIPGLKQTVALGGLALALAVTSILPLAGGHDVLAKKKPNAPNVAVQSITLEDHPNPATTSWSSRSRTSATATPTASASP